MPDIDPDGVLFFRVEKGHAADEELAALAVVLLARAAARARCRDAATPMRLRWHVCSYCVDGNLAFRAPHSWHAATSG